MDTPSEPQRFTYTTPVAVGASSTGVGVLIVFAAEWAGVPLTTEVAAAMAGLLVTGGALLTSRGIKGIFKALWRGESA
jgi:hypothetical protein